MIEKPRRARVLRDQVDYQRRNIEVLVAGGTVGSTILDDGSCVNWREMDGVRTSCDDEWLEMDADQVAAHYAALAKQP